MILGPQVMVIKHKKAYVYDQNFSVSVFSSSDIHQSHHLHGRQAVGINSSFIEAF